MISSSFIPAGFPAGGAVGPELADLLVQRGFYRRLPMIENGTYEDFKECVFSVLTEQAFNVAVEDMTAECREHGMDLHLTKQRRWGYSLDAQSLVTSVTISMRCPPQVNPAEFLKYLARKYGFTPQRVTCDYRQNESPVLPRRAVAWADGYATLSAELVWNYWM